MKSNVVQCGSDMVISYTHYCELYIQERVCTYSNYIKLRHEFSDRWWLSMVVFIALITSTSHHFGHGLSETCRETRVAVPSETVSCQEQLL